MSNGRYLKTASFDLLLCSQNLYNAIIIDIIIVIAHKSKTIYLVSNHMKLIIHI